MPKFSEDIVAEILSRLPVKSVCRFRCVSKSWLHLTKQPHFIKTHLKRTQKEKLILCSKSVFSLDHLAPIDDDLLPLELHFPLKGHPDSDQVHLLGSCNGLVCIRPQPEAVFVLNPSTGASIRIPDCPMPSHACLPQEPELFYDDPQHFGYAPSIDDYMFVKVAYGCMVLVFSLKNRSWKRVQDFPYKHEVDEFGTFLNGAIHWICGTLGPEGPCAIAAFDLAEEKFSDLATPDSVVGYINFTTGILGGCLCLLHQHPGRQHSFWVMKEYKVKESWTKILISDPYFILEPLCYWKDTKILLVKDRKQLLLCNPKDGTCKNLLANGLPIPCDAAVYLESLVSPNY